MAADFSCPSAEVPALKFLLGVFEQLPKCLATTGHVIILRMLLFNLFQGFIVFGQTLLDTEDTEYSPDKLGIGFSGYFPRNQERENKLYQLPSHWIDDTSSTAMLSSETVADTIATSPSYMGLFFTHSPIRSI